MDYSVFNEILAGLKKFYYSDVMLWIKFFLGVYTMVLLIDLILLLILQLPEGWRINLRGADIKVPGKKEIKKRWEAIEKYLSDKNESFWKVAILEADKLVDEVLTGFGYQGKNLGEKLAQVNENQLEHYQELKEAHQVRNRIIQEKDYKLSREEARKIVNIYGQYLQTVNLLD